MPTTGKNALSFGLLQALDTILQPPRDLETSHHLPAPGFSLWEQVMLTRNNILKKKHFSLVTWFSDKSMACSIFHHTDTEVFQLLQEAGKVKTAYFSRRKAQIKENTNTKVKNPVKKKRPYLDQEETGLTEHQKNRGEQQMKILSESVA